MAAYSAVLQSQGCWSLFGLHPDKSSSVWGQRSEPSHHVHHSSFAGETDMHVFRLEGEWSTRRKLTQKNRNLQIPNYKKKT